MLKILKKKSKKNILNNNEIDQKIINQTQDANNGLLMPQHYHKAFDLEKFFFDQNGIAVIKENFSNDFMIMNIKKFRIKQKAWNRQMSLYNSKKN